ncbi:MAG: ORF6N domain-containing protein [bacterium]|nr:ORF6N domain-containing protein [bacterium]
MSKAIIPVEHIESKILIIRGRRVILDADLARIYGVPTKRMNEQVKRNTERFPPDFVFRLEPEEVQILKSQIATSSGNACGTRVKAGYAHGGRRKLPLAFTEHGAIMAANVLNSQRAIKMSVFVVRAFISMRRMLVDQRDLARKLAELERKLTTRLNVHETAITEVLQQIMRLLNPPEEPEPDPELPPSRRIGFTVREKSGKYSNKRKNN